MFNTSTCRNVSLVHIRFQSETTSFLVYNLKTCLLSSRTPCSQHATVPGDSASLPSFLANCDSINLKNFFFFLLNHTKTILEGGTQSAARPTMGCRNSWQQEPGSPLPGHAGDLLALVLPLPRRGCMRHGTITANKYRKKGGRKALCSWQGEGVPQELLQGQKFTVVSISPFRSQWQRLLTEPRAAARPSAP